MLCFIFRKWSSLFFFTSSKISLNKASSWFSVKWLFEIATSGTFIRKVARLTAGIPLKLLKLRSNFWSFVFLKERIELIWCFVNEQQLRLRLWVLETRFIRYLTEVLPTNGLLARLISFKTNISSYSKLKLILLSVLFTIGKIATKMGFGCWDVELVLPEHFSFYCNWARHPTVLFRYYNF